MKFGGDSRSETSGDAFGMVGQRIAVKFGSRWFELSVDDR